MEVTLNSFFKESKQELIRCQTFLFMLYCICQKHTLRTQKYLQRDLDGAKQKDQIDHVLLQRKNTKSIVDAKSYRGTEANTDRFNLVIAKTTIREREEREYR